MKRIWILGIAGAAAGMMVYAYFAQTSAAEADPLGSVLLMSPEPAFIRHEVAAQSAANPQMTDTQRRDLFAELFTQRFRIHDSRMAVRAKFVPADHGQDRIKLMCPARMEPWNMDRIALVAWREAQTCFGHAYDIDIYETFIGASPRKIGELRTSGDKTPVASLCYLPPSSQKPLIFVPPFVHRSAVRASISPLSSGRLLRASSRARAVQIP